MVNLCWLFSYFSDRRSLLCVVLININHKMKKKTFFVQRLIPLIYLIRNISFLWITLEIYYLLSWFHFKAASAIIIWQTWNKFKKKNYSTLKKMVREQICSWILRYIERQRLSHNLELKFRYRGGRTKADSQIYKI